MKIIAISCALFTKLVCQSSPAILDGIFILKKIRQKEIKLHTRMHVNTIMIRCFDVISRLLQNLQDNLHFCVCNLSQSISRHDHTFDTYLLDKPINT